MPLLNNLGLLLNLFCDPTAWVYGFQCLNVKCMPISKVSKSQKGQGQGNVKVKVKLKIAMMIQVKVIDAMAAL